MIRALPAKAGHEGAHALVAAVSAIARSDCPSKGEITHGISSKANAAGSGGILSRQLVEETPNTDKEGQGQWNNSKQTTVLCCVPFIPFSILCV